MADPLRPQSPLSPSGHPSGLPPGRAAGGSADTSGSASSRALGAPGEAPLEVWEPAELDLDLTSGEPSIRTLKLGPGAQARPPGTLPGVVLEREIGRGRFGAVWRARLTLPSGLERRVVVRLVGVDGSTAGFLGRLRQEVDVYARLRHRAVARLEAVLDLESGPALVSEFIEGVDLADRLRSGAVPARAAAELLTELASALEAAHTGVVDRLGAVVTLTHGDLRPSSVRVTRWGEVMVLDLGTAAVVGAACGRTATPPGAAVAPPGRAGYFAPEVLAGAPVSASDLYALGALAWECRTGDRLPAMSSQRTVHAEQSSRALGRLDGRGWRPLVAGLLAWDPAARPSAREARLRFDALAHLCDGPSLREWADVRGSTSAPDVDLTSPGEGPDLGVDLETGSLSMSSRELSLNELSLNELSFSELSVSEPTSDLESAVTDRLVGESVDVDRTETLDAGFILTRDALPLPITREARPAEGPAGLAGATRTADPVAVPVGRPRPVTVAAVAPEVLAAVPALAKLPDGGAAPASVATAGRFSTAVATASAPTASAPTASAPTASAPTASAPTASAPTASAPTASAPTAPAPTAPAPTAPAPTASAPTASAPTASAPTAPAPTAPAPTAPAPTAPAPTASAPTASAPTASAPTAVAPSPTPSVPVSPTPAIVRIVPAPPAAQAAGAGSGVPAPVAGITAVPEPHASAPAPERPPAVIPVGTPVAPARITVIPMPAAMPAGAPAQAHASPSAPPAAARAAAPAGPPVVTPTASPAPRADRPLAPIEVPPPSIANPGRSPPVPPAPLKSLPLPPAVVRPPLAPATSRPAPSRPAPSPPASPRAKEEPLPTEGLPAWLSLGVALAALGGALLLLLVVVIYLVILPNAQVR